MTYNASASEIYQLKGKGINGKDCMVEVIKDAQTLHSVKLTGASKIFEILADTPDGYRPRTYISENGAPEVISLLTDNPELFQRMSVSYATFGNSITYKLDSSDISSEDTGGIKGIIKIKLSFKGNQLSKVDASFKGRAFVFTLASSEFECR